MLGLSDESFAKSNVPVTAWASKFAKATECQWPKLPLSALARYPGEVIPVIDLFAGPGGLGEGFASLLDKDGKPLFRIALSIEMNVAARTTLRLRSFFRQFAKAHLPDDYYQFLRGDISVEDLYERFPEEAAASDREAWQAELGKESPEEVDRRISTALGGAERWLLIGGPPCQAYSLVGRSRRANQTRKVYESDIRHFLYQEYLRIIAVHRPPIFVMENVKGILSSKMKGTPIVSRIIADLKSPLTAGLNLKRSTKPLNYELHPFSDYNEALPFEDAERAPSDYVIRSELHGIPQARHRFIVLGVSLNAKWKPNKLRNVPQPVTVQDAIGDLPHLRSRLSGKGSSKKEQDTREVWAASIGEMFALQLDPANGVDPEVATKIADSVLNLRDVGSGSQFRTWKRLPTWNSVWFSDPRLQGVCNHESRRHMKEDLWRYMFAACFAAINKKSPTLMDFPPDLLPDHKNIDAIGSENSELVFADRFRVQVRNRPSTTVTSHISKDGHYFIHHDPKQCRSLSVREAARLQTFPDNYFFMGGKTVQYHQVGNAVPPLLASKLARIVAGFFETAAG